MKPGYKQTEVGVIPEEWEVKPLGEIGGVRMCKRVLKHQTRERGDVPFYKIGTFGGVADAFIPQSLFDEFRRKYSFPRKGDILISAAGTIGRTVEYDGAPAYFQDSNIVWIDNDESKVTNAYLWHRYQVTKWSVSHGGTVARLYNDSLRTKIHIPVPSCPEQRAIAEALSDVDRLLGGLDRLIAKKRDLKQAAMQQLLTGQTRLPGFHGEWATKELGKLGKITGAGVDKKTRPGERPVRLVNYMDVYRRDFIHSEDLDHVVSASTEQAARCAVRKGDVFFTPSSEMPFDIALSAVAMADIPDACYSYHVVRLRLDEDWDLNFRAYAFKTRSFLEQAAKTCEGSGVRYVITQGKFRQLTVRYPTDKHEQTAIADALTAMDAELTALEQRREKTRALKQAMMQELLTGRTRLV
ncbi:MAG TPA: restriction endonuclease subunit S [Opitutaceae bacterium]|nr:restriction endonuclease subunit S [Opitutaceae bacterium]